MPIVSRVVWQRFESEVIERVIIPALLELFAPAIIPHYTAVVSQELAQDTANLPMRRAEGRVMLRCPGYRLPPHVDPKR